MNKIVILGSCIAIAVVSLFFLKKTISNHILDGPGMSYRPEVKSLDYYHGGDEYGRSTSIYMKDSTFQYHRDEGTVGGSTKACYAIDDNFRNSLTAILGRYAVLSWTDLGPNEVQVLDGATTSLSISFEDGTIIRLGDSYEMPDHGWEFVRDIVNLFESYLPKTDQ